MNCIATTPGLYPLPDRAKRTLSDLKGHQKEDLIGGDEGTEITDEYDRAREEVVAVQRNAGLDRIVEGQLRWDDMLAHPLTVHDNVETGGIVRYYDNNNFYRDPVVTGELTFDGDVAAELEAVDADSDSMQAVLPGPYSLAKLATDGHYGDEADFLAAVGDFVAAEVEAFPDHGTLFLLEPSLVTDAPTDGFVDRAADAVDEVASATDAEVVVHGYWGALSGDVHGSLLDTRADALGYDLVTAEEANLNLVSEFGTADRAAFGVVDGQNTLVESPAEIKERVGRAADAAGDLNAAYVTTNTELFYLPQNRFEEKLAALGEAVSLAEVEA